MTKPRKESFAKALMSTFVVYVIIMLRLADVVLTVLSFIVSSSNNVKTVVNVRG